MAGRRHGGNDGPIRRRCRITGATKPTCVFSGNPSLSGRCVSAFRVRLRACVAAAAARSSLHVTGGGSSRSPAASDAQNVGVRASRPDARFRHRHRSPTPPAGQPVAIYDWSIGFAGGPIKLVIHDPTGTIAMPPTELVPPAWRDNGWFGECAGKVQQLIGHYYICVIE